MTIGDVLEVLVEPDSHKFIVALLADGNGGKRLVLRAQSEDCCEYHADIFDLLLVELRKLRIIGLKARCIGGGRIRINTDAKTVNICDDSAEFGEEPNRQETIRMLQVAFPGFYVTANQYF